jgi:hypothetical protein
LNFGSLWALMNGAVILHIVRQDGCVNDRFLQWLNRPPLSTLSYL